MKRYVLMFEYDSKKFMNINKIILFKKNLNKIEENGILQIATSYTTGWKAYIDGVPTDTIRVNTAFIGIPLEAGEHQIYLEYEVPYEKLGIVCTLIGVLGFIVLVIIEWRCLRKK